jgi:outer membrane receptor protein involved in Fe transport
VFGNADDQRVTSNGLYWPGLLSFAWDLKYDISAPYLNIGGKFADFNWDASVRRDKLKVRGVNVSVCCGNAGGFDYDGNGTIEPFEARGRSIASSTTPQRANYTTSHTSFSLGGSYLLSNSMSVFARYSKGASFPADRLLQIGGALKADGSLSSTSSGYDEVKQIEAGFKWAVGRTSFYATLFNTKVDETNAEVTSGLTFLRSYKANGVELEGNWRSDSGFGVSGNLTYTEAKIDQDKLTPALNGTKPRRQAPYIFTITPSYQASIWEVGVTAQGSGSYVLENVPSGTANQLKQKAYMIFNAYGSVSFTDALSASLSVNNLSDEIVATEVEEGAAAPGSYVRGRLLTGRTTNLALKYKF